jgi:hypothetical protein
VGNNDRYASAHRAAPDHQRPFAFDQRCKANTHARHVGDRIIRARLQHPYDDAQITRSHMYASCSSSFCAMLIRSLVCLLFIAREQLCFQGFAS